MKNLAFLCTAFFLYAGLHAQPGHFYYPDAFYFVKEVKAEGLAGKAFRFEISVQEKPSDTFSKVRIYTVQVRKGREDIIGRTFTYAVSAGSNGWNTYRIEDTVDQEATRVWLYVSVNGNGNFYFDRLRYFISDANGVLQYTPLANGSFEEKGRQVLKDYYVSKQASPGFVLSVATDPVLEGEQSLHLFTAGMRVTNNINTIVKQ